MSQLTKRVILVHELRQLGRTEELFHCCSYRFNIDKGLRRNRLCVLCCHSLTNHTLQSGKTDAVLVLKKLTYCTDTTVSKMVDVVIVSNAVFQVHIVVNRSKNIFFCNMLRNQIMNISADRSFLFLESVIFFQNFFKHRVIY